MNVLIAIIKNRENKLKFNVLYIDLKLQPETRIELWKICFKHMQTSPEACMNFFANNQNYSYLKFKYLHLKITN